MIDLKVDDDADLVFESGDVGMVSEVDEVKQNVALALRTVLGEFFADKSIGLDRRYILGKSYNEQYATAAITDCLQKDPRVTSVNSINLTKGNDRHLNAVVAFTIDATISTVLEVDQVA